MKILKTLLLYFSLCPIFLLAQTSDTLSVDKTVKFRVFQKNVFKEVYKVNIDLKEQHLSGLMVVRKTADSVLRIAFVTEVGMKIFEFEFYPRKKDNFKLISIIDQLNKKVIVNTLKRDFQSVFMTFADYKTPKIKKKNDSLQVTYYGEGKRIYTANNQGIISKMLRKKLFMKKELIQFTYNRYFFPETILIEHQGVKLNIKMKLVDSNPFK